MCSHEKGNYTDPFRWWPLKIQTLQLLGGGQCISALSIKIWKPNCKVDPCLLFNIFSVYFFLISKQLLMVECFASSFFLRFITFWLQWWSSILLSLVVASWGCSFLWCAGFSRCRAQALGAQAQLIVAHRLSCSVARGIFLDQGSKKKVSPALQGGILITGPPGKPHILCFWLKTPLPLSGDAIVAYPERSVFPRPAGSGTAAGLLEYNVTQLNTLISHSQGLTPSIKGPRKRKNREHSIS